MTREGWAAILEDIFSFERDPGTGRVLFIVLFAIITVIVAIYLKVKDKDGEHEEEGSDQENS